ncbi:hypothetical protein Tco_1062739 [Tanacetum coccineum]
MQEGQWSWVKCGSAKWLLLQKSTARSSRVELRLEDAGGDDDLVFHLRFDHDFKNRYAFSKLHSVRTNTLCDFNQHLTCGRSHYTLHFASLMYVEAVVVGCYVFGRFKLHKFLSKVPCNG